MIEVFQTGTAAKSRLWPPDCSPLQASARAYGRVFVEEGPTPYPDQWAFMVTILPMPAQDIAP